MINTEAWKYCFYISSCSLALTCFSRFSSVANAQPVPDRTPNGDLGTNVSSDTFADLALRRDIPGDRITGGVRRGANLFHSFTRFSVEEGRGVYFENPVGVTNIFGRVTGGSPSNVFGKIAVVSEGGSVLATANLFLINPSGFFFGRNASLNLNGSFFVTTADAIRIGETGSFNALEPASSNLLNIEPSAFLFGANPRRGSITSQANAANVLLTGPNDFPEMFGGLQVSNERDDAGTTLLLLGGNVTIEGGKLNAGGGRIEIGSVQGEGEIGLNPDRSLEFPENIERSDITFTGASIDVSLDDDRGDISITGRNITFNSSSIGAERVFDFDQRPEVNASNLILDATGSIVIENLSRISNKVNNGVAENAGNLQISATSLFINNSEVTTSTLGRGNAGDINIHVRDQISLNRGNIRATSEASAVESSGSVRIIARLLTLSNGAEVSTRALGQREGGRITIRTDGLQLRGEGTRITAETSGQSRAGDIRIRSDAVSVSRGGQIRASTASSSRIGRGGDIRIRANEIQVHGENALITAGTSGQGRAGDIEINSPSIDIRRGGQIRTSTVSAGRAGDITLNVRQGAVDIQGQGSGIFAATGRRAEGAGGSIGINRADDLRLLNRSRISAQSQGSGRGGNITIDDAANIQLRQRSTITAQSQRSGNGGSITIDTDNLSLSQNSRITAQSQRSGEAGSLKIDATDRLSTNNSDIETSASRSTGGSIDINGSDAELGEIRLNGDSDVTTDSRRDGGDIYIGGISIIAFGDSDILTRSVQDNGGDIQLDSPAFFGDNLQQNATDQPNGNNRVDLNTLGDLTAGIINLPDVEPVNNSLARIEDDLINTDTLLANSCIVRSDQQGSLTVTGSGGFPTHPGEVTVSPYPTGEVRSLPAPIPPPPVTHSWRPGDPIVESQGTYRSLDGRRVLSRPCSDASGT
jgi:filamentous hemagglutinin family protein